MRGVKRWHVLIGDACYTIGISDSAACIMWRCSLDACCDSRYCRNRAIANFLKLRGEQELRRAGVRRDKTSARCNNEQCTAHQGEPRGTRTHLEIDQVTARRILGAFSAKPCDGVAPRSIRRTARGYCHRRVLRAVVVVHVRRNCRIRF